MVCVLMQMTAVQLSSRGAVSIYTMRQVLEHRMARNAQVLYVICCVHTVRVVLPEQRVATAFTIGWSFEVMVKTCMSNLIPSVGQANRLHAANNLSGGEAP